MQPRHLEALTFSLKAALSAVAGVLSYGLLHLPGSTWVAAVSAVVVTQPTLHSSLKASLLRVAANLAGAVSGAAFALLFGQPLAAMALGIMLVGLGCYALKLDDMLRPAFVAVILVTLAGESGEWQASRNRVVGVLVGCLCAVIVGFLVEKLSAGVKVKSPAADKTGANE
jgi:uncharacterized membrane protein YgaE (UPF0421/DUF939 family)